MEERPMNKYKIARPLLDRRDAAAARFREAVIEQFGFTADEAARIMAVYVKAKAVKLCPVMGQFNLTDGRLWDRDVMARAIEQP
jgi:hypothetical protein